jgi:hypothetical protein
MLDASVKAREDAAAFDTSRLVEFSERLLWEGPVLGLSPLVREPGRLAITDTRVYFQPLHNISGEVCWQLLTRVCIGSMIITDQSVHCRTLHNI